MKMQDDDTTMRDLLNLSDKIPNDTVDEEVVESGSGPVPLISMIGSGVE